MLLKIRVNYYLYFIYEVIGNHFEFKELMGSFIKINLNLNLIFLHKEKIFKILFYIN